MVNTFGILTALVLAFTAFVSFKNKEEFEIQLKNTNNEQAKLDQNTKTFNGLVADNKQLLADTEAANKSKAEYQVKLDAQNTENEGLKTSITTKEKILGEVKDELANADDLLKELGPIASLAPKIGQLNTDISDLTDEVEILNTTNNNLTGEKKRTSEALASAKSKLSDITSGRSLPAMKAKIDRIDRRLGFVVLTKGIKQGVVGGSRVAVMRGGEKIAELSVTAVSSDAATANIIHSSLKEGENLVVGDTVVPVEGLAQKAAE